MTSELLKGFEEHIYSQPSHADSIASAIFVFDTNILLNIYRWRRDTFDTFTSCLEEIDPDNIFVTSQIRREFFRNRITHAFVFTRLSHLGHDLADTARKRCKTDFDQYMRADLKDKLLGDLEEAFSSLTKTVNAIINQELENKLSLLNDDPFLTKLASVITKVYDPFDDNRRKSIEGEATQRKAKIIEDRNAKTPDKNADKNEIDKFPGYSDSDKGFGDYIIFHELLELAKEKTKNIVFVTDEKKDDWFYNIHGKTESIRLNVKRKFVDISQTLDIWDSLEFLKRVATAKHIKIGDDTVQDVKRVAQATQEDSNALYVRELVPYAIDGESDQAARPKAAPNEMPPSEMEISDEAIPVPDEEPSEANAAEGKMKARPKSDGKEG